MTAFDFFSLIFQHRIIFLSLLLVITLSLVMFCVVLRTPFFVLFYLLYSIPAIINPLFLLLVGGANVSAINLAILCLSEILLILFVFRKISFAFVDFVKPKIKKDNFLIAPIFYFLSITMLKVFLVGGDKSVFIGLHNVAFFPLLMTINDVIGVYLALRASRDRSITLLLFLCVCVLSGGMATGSNGGFFVTIFLYALIYFSFYKQRVLRVKFDSMLRALPAVFLGLISISFFTSKLDLSFGFVAQRLLMANDMLFFLNNPSVIEMAGAKYSLFQELMRPISIRLFGNYPPLGEAINMAVNKGAVFGGSNFRILPFGLLSGQILQLLACLAVVSGVLIVLPRVKLAGFPKHLKSPIIILLSFFAFQDLYKFTSLTALVALLVILSFTIQIFSLSAPKKTQNPEIGFAA